MVTSLFLFTIIIVLSLIYKLLKASIASYKKIFSGLILWLIITALLAKSDILMEFNQLPPRMLLVLLPVIITLIFVSRSEKLHPIIEKTPQSLLIYAQSFRLLVEIVLFLLIAQGLVPEIMSWKGRNFDILIPLTAPIWGYFYCYKKTISSTALKLWNYLGIGLLVNVVCNGFLSAPTPFQVFVVEPANTFVATWPYVWLPTFLVPSAIFFHIISIRKASK